MDEARRYLSSRASPSYRFGFTQTVEALASIANSRDRSNVLGSWYRDIVSRTPTSKLRAGPQARNKTDSATPSHEVLLAIESALACSSSQARRIASACPLLDEARCVDLHVKVVQLKAALPDCNVPVLIERRPEIFLGENIDDLLGTVSWRYNFLKTVSEPLLLVPLLGHSQRVITHLCTIAWKWPMRVGSFCGIMRCCGAFR